PDAAIREILDGAGAADCTLRADPVAAQRFVVRDGVPVPLPHTVAEFTASPLLSLAGRLRLIKERFIPAHRESSDESVDAFARRRFGDEVADRMFDPLVASTSAGDPQVLLARYAFPNTVGHEQRSGSGLQGNLRARMEQRRRAKGKPREAWSGRSGMQQVARQLAAHIADIRTGARVERVSGLDGRVSVEVNGAAAESFDGVIVAVPVPALSQLSFDLPGAEKLDAVSGIPQRSIVAVSLGYRRQDVAHPLDGGRMLVPSIERLALLSAVFPSSIFPERAPMGHVLITAYLGGARRPEAIDWPEAELVATAHGELALLLGISGEPRVHRVARWRDALPQAVAGHSRRFAAADSVEAAAGAVAFTGAWRDGLSVAEVLAGGVHAADRLAVRREWRSVPTPG
ncbi:MAG: protoporphyrinogen oxidase, partial [Gemmatimonadales bacterium]